MKTLKMPSSVWDPLTNEEKAYIKGILVGSHSITHNDEIISDPTLEQPSPQAKGIIPGVDLPGIDDLAKEACKIACDLAAGTALGVCSGISNGLAAAACIVAAEAARQECKKRC